MLSMLDMLDTSPFTGNYLLACCRVNPIKSAISKISAFESCLESLADTSPAMLTGLWVMFGAVLPKDLKTMIW